MPESLYRQQNACKPRVEDVLHDVLGEDAGKALAFVDALRDAKIRLSWTLTNQWKTVYKGRNLCRITLSSGQSWAQYRRWVVTAYLERLADYEQTVCAEGLEEYLWKHVFYCVHKPADADPPPKLRQYAMLPPCNAHGCAPGKTITVCGKTLTNICQSLTRQYFWFRDPDEKALAALLRLLTLERHAREAAAFQKRKTGGGQDAQP